MRIVVDSIALAGLLVVATALWWSLPGSLQTRASGGAS